MIGIESTYADTYTENEEVWSGDNTSDGQEFIVQQDGWYEINCKGGKGIRGTYTGETLPDGGTGGDITGKVYLKKGYKLTARVFAGGSGGTAYGNDFRARWGAGGEAVAIVVNDTIPVVGAGGGGGSFRMSTSGYVTSIDNAYFSSGRGGGTQDSGGRKTPCGIGNTFQGYIGASLPNTNCAGSAGKNLLNTAIAELIEQPNGNMGTGSFSVKYINSEVDGREELSTKTGSFISIDTEGSYKASDRLNYRIDAQANNGDKITGNIELKKGDFVDVLAFGNSRAIAINNKIEMVIASPKTTLSAERVWFAPTTLNSYANGEIFTETVYDNDDILIPTFSQVQITCIGVTLDMVYEEIKDISGSNNSDEVPTLTVVKDMEFSYILCTYDDMNTASNGDIRVENDVKGDKMIRVEGKVRTAGDSAIYVDSKLFVFRAVEEPDSSNISAVIN